MAMFEYTTKVEIMKALLEILKELKAIRKAMETKKNQHFGGQDGLKRSNKRGIKQFVHERW